ncbi:heat shock factor 2-binding protein [Megalopta genalis]|uniref:heat shock factor 2-binding protein n=1 Tax=Megalopta genalis TaxID=115081 RepID=UPI001443386F|nr:heat shock factor 2-binding protein-like [Megalopta genalis]XP_033324171.1 heat shock factor 2-binding protein-like [Megalopta genalis]
MKTDAYVDETNVKDEESFLISVKDTLTTVQNSVHNFIKDVPRALFDSGLDFDIEKLTISDSENIELRSLPQPLTEQTVKQNEEKTEIINLELECERLRTQLHQQLEANKIIQREIEYMKEQLFNQSAYCTSLGAVLGNLTWRASRFPEIVDVWLSAFQHKIGELLSITDGSFEAFMKTYRTAFPPTSNDEYQFIISLLGIVTNISASPEGREFLITNSNGKDFIKKIVTLMPTLPISQGTHSIKRLMLMTLYNVSMNETGLLHLFDSRIGDALNYYLRNDSLPDEVQLLCLRVLHSITYDLTDPKYIQDLITSLSIDKIEDIAAASKNEMSSFAKQVIKNLRNSQKYLSQN